MLVLTRKKGEEIKIQCGDETIRVVLVRVKGSTAQIGVDAVQEVRVIRSEIQGEEKCN